MAYRAVVSRPLEFYLENRDRFTSHNELMGFSSGKEKEGCNEKPLYESTDVMTFHNLVTHDGAGQFGQIIIRVGGNNGNVFF